MARSLNRVQLIGNLTRDPELRYTPSGTAVCTFGLATNRSWTTETGEKHEETEFHRIVSWNKLAELCSQFLVKGRKVYVEGRLSTRSWTAADGTQKSTTEVVIDDMILLDFKRPVEEAPAPYSDRKSQAVQPDTEGQEDKNPTEETLTQTKKAVAKQTKESAKEKEEKEEAKKEDGVDPSDIPF